MSNISIDDVKKLAVLSSISVSDDEAAALTKDLESILAYVEQLKAVDTTGVEPTYQVTDLHNVWRSDVIDDYGLTKEPLLALAPQAEQDQVKVPKVL